MAAEEIYYEDVEIGDDIGPMKRVVTLEQVREFTKVWRSEAGHSRFTSDEVAQSEGLPGAISPGAMNIALMSQLISNWSHTATLKKLDVVFRQVVRHNAPLQIKGVITDKDIVDGTPQLECDVIMENEEGSSLVIGKATVVLPTRS